MFARMMFCMMSVLWGIMGIAMVLTGIKALFTPLENHPATAPVCITLGAIIFCLAVALTKHSRMIKA